MRDHIESEELRRVGFFATYEASNLGADQIEWPHLFLGLIREAKSVIRSFLGSYQAVLGLSLKIRETIPSRPRVRTSFEIPMAADCKTLVQFADRDTLGQRRHEAPLEVLLVSMLKNQPDWFRPYGLDSEVFAKAFAYPPVLEGSSEEECRYEPQGVGDLQTTRAFGQCP
jgi:hypothetical protein